MHSLDPPKPHSQDSGFAQPAKNANPAARKGANPPATDPKADPPAPSRRCPNSTSPKACRPVGAEVCASRRPESSVQDHPKETSHATGALRGLQHLHAPDVGADQGAVAGVQLSNAAPTQGRFAHELQVLGGLPGARIGVPSPSGLTDATPKGVILPLHRPPGRPTSVSSTLHVDQPILNVLTILPASILRHVARGLPDAWEYVWELLNRLPGMKHAELPIPQLRNLRAAGNRVASNLNPLWHPLCHPTHAPHRPLTVNIIGRFSESELFLIPVIAIPDRPNHKYASNIFNPRAGDSFQEPASALIGEVSPPVRAAHRIAGRGAAPVRNVKPSRVAPAPPFCWGTMLPAA